MFEKYLEIMVIHTIFFPKIQNLNIQNDSVSIYQVNNPQIVL